MTKQDLPTIDIKGKAYVQVKDRVSYFNDTYPNGRIQTEILKNENGKIVIKAVVLPDTKNPERWFTGHSQADESQGMINKTSALENAETSAVGRALAMMGIGIIDSVGSADEVKKAISTPIKTDPTEDWKSPSDVPDKTEPATNSLEHFCMLHNKEMKDRGRGIWDHRSTLNENQEYDKQGMWHYCMGNGWKLSINQH
jgi:hypothetical protein